MPPFTQHDAMRCVAHLLTLYERGAVCVPALPLEERRLCASFQLADATFYRTHQGRYVQLYGKRCALKLTPAQYNSYAHLHALLDAHERKTQAKTWSQPSLFDTVPQAGLTRGSMGDKDNHG
jgi:serine/threonine protein kinase HipA of HipAB toxin-antitoxin module